MTALISRPCAALAGTVSAPGDKSISHRALMFAALAVGRSSVTGLLESDDVAATARALAALGAGVERRGPGDWVVDGVGVGGFAAPADVIDLGNSGTSARLLAGLVASQPIGVFLTGDGSLRARPMARVVRPLVAMGARFTGSDGWRLPMHIQGAAEPLPIEYRLPVASAQVKSAILLAGLNTPGRTTVIEPHPTRDHSERMLRAFGAEVAVSDDDAGTNSGGGRRITVTGHPELAPCDVAVPGDPSSAAIVLVAALVVAGAEVTVRGVGVNPLRTGVFETLVEMGADLEIRPTGDQGGEPVADITARGSRLRAVRVPAARAPRMIDEYPILAVAAACAKGTTVMEGLAELRVKESDRLAAIADGLAVCGVTATIDGDTLSVEGVGGTEAPAGGGPVATHMDHRIAMAFLVLGFASRDGVRVDDGAMIATSFPGFAGCLAGLGATIEVAGP